MTPSDFEDELTSIHIDYDQVIRAREVILALYDRAARRRNPVCLFVTGDTGSGKTTIAERVEAEILSRQTDPNTCPVALVSVPARCTSKALLSAILVALDHPDPYKGSQTLFEQRLVKWARRKGVRMIILDEAQHLVNPKNASKNYDVADVIKVVINQLKITLILVGDHGVDALCKNRQLFRRLRRRFRLTPFGYETEKEQARFCAFLLKYDVALPFSEYCHLSSPALAAALFRATGGLVGWVVQLIWVATDYALEENARRIEPRHLAEAWHEIRAPYQPNEPNPFRTVAIPGPKPKARRSGPDELRADA